MPKQIITYFICLGFGMAILGSCKKTELTEGKLHILRGDNGDVISGARVLIYETDADSVSSVTLSKTPYAVFYSNSLGEVPLSITRKSGKSYAVIVTCYRYANSTQSNNGDVIVLDNNTSTKQEIRLYPQATVQLHVRNASPVNSADSIFIDGCSAKKFGFRGMNIDVYLYCSNCSCQFSENVATLINYTVMKKNIPVSQEQISFMPPALFDTLKLEINY